MRTKLFLVVSAMSILAGVILISAFSFYTQLLVATSPKELLGVTELQPGNVWVWESLGDYLYSSRPASSLEGENDLTDIEAYQRAIEAEPAKAQHWLMLAYAKAKSAQYDLSFYQALEKAFTYGASEYHINRGIMEIGLAHWYSINFSSRLILKQVVVRLYQHNAYATISLAREYGQLRMVCIWASSSGSVEKICEKELAD